MRITTILGTDPFTLGWSFAGTFVNDSSQASSDASVNYFINVDLLNEPTASAWWVSRGGKSAFVNATFNFPNGQTAIIQASGQFNMFKPTISNFQPDSGMQVVLDTNGIPEIYLGLGTDRGNGMGWNLTVNVNTNFSGSLFYEQLIDRDFEWDLALAGIGLINMSDVTGGFWLDNGIPYGSGSHFDNTAVHTQWPMSFGDGPELSSRLYSFANLQDQFQTYIEFQPSGGIPVTIGVVNWSWYGRTDGSFTTSIWILTGQSITGPTLNADDDSFPTYPHTYHNAD